MYCSLGIVVARWVMFQTAGSGVILVGFNLIENHGSRFGPGVGGGGLSSPLRQTSQKKHHISAASEEALTSQKRSKRRQFFYEGDSDDL